LPLDNDRVFKPVNIALLTVSDTRGIDDDTSGDILAERIIAAGHNIVDRTILRDDTTLITARLHNRWYGINRTGRDARGVGPRKN
jgi:molybdopterin adenylyltransferase